MATRVGGTIEMEGTVEVDVSDLLAHASVEELMVALRERGSSDGDPLARIWEEVVHLARPLDEVVAELMRERQWTWRGAGERAA